MRFLQFKKLSLVSIDNLMGVHQEGHNTIKFFYGRETWMKIVVDDPQVALKEISIAIGNTNWTGIYQLQN